MPVEKHETHLLESPVDDAGIVDATPLIGGGQGRSVADLQASVDQLLTGFIFLMLVVTFFLVFTALRN